LILNQEITYFDEIVNGIKTAWRHFPLRARLEQAQNQGSIFL
jgi:hypothetical protein